MQTLEGLAHRPSPRFRQKRLDRLGQGDAGTQEVPKFLVKGLFLAEGEFHPSLIEPAMRNTRQQKKLDSSPAADARWIRLALREAGKGIGFTSPNPAVGAVIVRDGRALARGHHHAAGQPHAEIEALRALPKGKDARGATLYVTLEPCSTQGRTPPCTSAIVAAGLARVVYGATDPNPRHAGRAAELLRAAGIQVTAGVLEAQCRDLNAPFNKWIATGEPWVVAKAAITLDGGLTLPPGQGRWLSGPLARAHAHRQRARIDAILIGAGTLRADNPRLTVRGVAGPVRQPWRVVVSRSGDLPPGSHLFTDRWREKTLVFRGQHTLREVLRDLGRRQITSVLIEGGADVLAQAFREGAVDEVQLYVTPWPAGGDGPRLALREIRLDRASIHLEQLGPDLLLTGRTPVK